MAPVGVPAHVVARLHSEVVKALRRTDVQAELAAQCASATIDKGPDEMAAYIKSETQKWSRVISALGLKAQ
jgi:tripartite-type tricarboxylate transporter receptor subunit TctC